MRHPPPDPWTLVWDLSLRRTSWPGGMPTRYQSDWGIPPAAKSFSEPIGFGNKAQPAIPFTTSPRHPSMATADFASAVRRAKTRSG